MMKLGIKTGFKRCVWALALSVAGIGVAQAGPIFDEFGALPGVEFGGDGIPNGAVAISRAQTSAGELTLGITAHQRFVGPNLQNDGAGTFIADTGTNFSPGGTEGAVWNFAFHINLEGQGTTFDDLVGAGYSFQLAYDVDPGNGTDFGILLFDPFLGGLATIEGSQNLLFGFLFDDDLPFITAPSGGFNPNVAGLYSFELSAISPTGGTVLAAIDVRVVPVPASLGLLGLGLIGFGFMRRRKSVH
ncbi:hypothetical protein GCM10007972_14180 [Iodidimonas muriae]|uniref:Ice-binding protein C-terminal domain-containing protein n=1 Tax=Iodidimonas muriae TaxID=261467 RepID=A0ABQ2LD07_9PROT|nr:VPLPA-CTERM sorting domain-containing protein [Iodidimonas muriae]GER07340.1 hypothetical protein JCM17843_16500 [Kordiimonadales bacterium JCM 17843]GGO10906.1 hypothetical protein GCM10007972_14180 [Iodidimonas muriae]